MIVIGIEKDYGLVYEGNGNYGRGLWPTPMITTAKFVHPSEKELKAHPSSSSFGCRFREDSYDPIARIRRGRFYSPERSLSKEWICSHHPSFPLDAIDPHVHAKKKSLETFYGQPVWSQYPEGRKKLPIVLLGVDGRFTSWTIIDIEPIFTGEDLVTLKARSSFGLLPNIDNDKVPTSFQAKLNESLEIFADEIHRSAPSSVIDRARDVAVYALLSRYDLQKDEVLDLGKLIKKLESDGHTIAANVSNIIARLHARAKPSEQEKRELRPVREKDADLVVQCVGTLLCEIGLAEWA